MFMKVVLCDYVLQVLLAEDLAVTSDCSCLRVWSLPCATTIATFNTQVSREDTRYIDTKYLILEQQ